MDRPDELEQVKYPDYLAKWEIFADYNSIPQSRRLHVYNDAQGRHVCQRLKEVIPSGGFSLHWMGKSTTISSYC